MKKLIPVLVAIVLIIVIGAATYGRTLKEKYSYSDEYADLEAYFGNTGEDDVPIILQNDKIEEHAKIWDGVCYFDYDMVRKYFNDGFYLDSQEGLLLYALPDTVVATHLGSSSYTIGESDNHTEDYVITRQEGDMLYIAADYVQQYANFSYELFTDPYHMQIYTEWERKEVADINKDTQVRYQGGVKSDILTQVYAGDTVEILDVMDTWTKVKTKDAYIGYVENKRLDGSYVITPTPVTSYEEPEYTNISKDYTINLAWHTIYTTAGNDTLSEVLSGTKSINTISPTWFTLTDSEGNFESFAASSYVESAHNKGIEVWPLISNISDTAEIDMYALLSKTSTRTQLINNIMEAILACGADGINIDFEDLSMDTGEAFVEFIRELSIPCRAEGIVLSVDNYVPTSYNGYYGRAAQGVVADYVVIMGYDEHHGGSTEAGSVASIDFVEAGIADTVADVPAEKVINAIPFYTRIWTTEGATVTSQVVDMDTAAAYVANHNIETQWDEETCQNYGEYQSDSGFHQVWLEDADSIQVKLNVMRNYDLAGVAEWRLGLENSSVWDEIAAYVNY